MEDIKQKVDMFLEEKTYTFIQKNNSNIYNGFIVKVTGNHLIFNDDLVGKIPILFSEIKVLEYSKRKGDRQ